MFQRLLLVMTLLSLPAVAAAQGTYTDRYWGGYLGGVTSADAEGDSVIGLDPAQKIDLRPSSDFTLGAIVGATIDDNLRAELELSFQSTDSDGVDLGSSSSNASGGFASTALTLNFWYDFPTLGRIRPYAGAGIGVATVKNDISTGNGDTSFDGRGEGFTYQIGAGLQFPVSDTSSIDLGYRYRTVHDLAFKSKSDVVYSKIDLETHSVQIAYRMNF